MFLPTRYQVNKELNEILPDIFSDKIWKIVIYDPIWGTIEKFSKVRIGKWRMWYDDIDLFFSGWYIPLRKFDPVSMIGTTRDLCPIMFLETTSVNNMIE